MGIDIFGTIGEWVMWLATQVLHGTVTLITSLGIPRWDYAFLKPLDSVPQLLSDALPYIRYFIPIDQMLGALISVATLCVLFWSWIVLFPPIYRFFYDLYSKVSDWFEISGRGLLKNILTFVKKL